jgi:hypothetical protein
MDEIHPGIIEVPQSFVSEALQAAGLAKAEFVLYEVPEKACIENAGLTEAQVAQFDWQAVWAAVEIGADKENMFWDAVAYRARYADRFHDFVRAVRQAVIQREGDTVMIAFRGFQWDPDEPTDQ